MRATEIRELTKDEIEKKIVELKKDLSEVTFKNSTNQLENPMLIRTIRRNIARLKTVLAEK